MKYLNKELSEYNVWELCAILSHFNSMEAKRDKSKQHIKFNKMDFPSPNPAYLELKQSIEQEIENRK